MKVSLVWGSTPADRQTAIVTKVGPNYRKVFLNFQVKSDSDDARLEIASTGTGSFHVGAVSLMPTDNVQGFRAELIAALKQLHSGVYRWPGATSCLDTNGAMRLAIRTSVLPSWTPSGTRFSRTTLARMSS